MKTYMPELKERIISIRNEHKLSQAQVAKKLSIGLETYKKLEREIEKGGIKVNGDHLKNLCNVYRLDSGDYFLFGKKLEREQPEFYFDN